MIRIIQMALVWGRTGAKVRRCKGWARWVAMTTRTVSRFNFTEAKAVTKVEGNIGGEIKGGLEAKVEGNKVRYRRGRKSVVGRKLLAHERARGEIDPKTRQNLMV